MRVLGWWESGGFKHFSANQAIESPADMEINSFSAEKEENGYSEEFGCNVVRVNFSPTGWRSMFWEGDYYFRSEDARVMGYRGDGAPGKPSSKTTLVKEY